MPRCMTGFRDYNGRRRDASRDPAGQPRCQRPRTLSSEYGESLRVRRTSAIQRTTSSSADRPATCSLQARAASSGWTARLAKATWPACRSRIWREWIAWSSSIASRATREDRSRETRHSDFRPSDICLSFDVRTIASSLTKTTPMCAARHPPIALVIAAAGTHSLLMLGSPGSGKMRTYHASVPSILPLGLDVFEIRYPFTGNAHSPQHCHSLSHISGHVFWGAMTGGDLAGP